jgi:hypothetical protein
MPPTEPIGRYDLPQDITGHDAQCGSDIEELDNIDPSLAIFVFGNKGLRPAQHARQIRLRHTFLLAGGQEHELEALLSWRVQGFRHSKRGFLAKREPFR